MRILLAAGSLPPAPCGVGDYTAQLARALAASGAAHVGLLAPRGASDVAGVDMVPVAGAWRARELPGVARAMRSWQPDVVHLHYPSQGFYGRRGPALLPLAARWAEAHVAQTWHEAWPLRALPRLLLHRAAGGGLLFVRPQYPLLLPRPLRGLLKGLPQLTVGSASPLPAASASVAERDALRARHLAGARRLVVFFGFILPPKGVERVFEIADPQTDALVIAGPVGDESYGQRLRELAAAPSWAGRVSFTGFLTPQDAANLLAAADAVVLPFRDGAGEWNTSVNAALAQGTLVITTSLHPGGDDPARNLYTAGVTDTAGMKGALKRLGGRRRPPVVATEQWGEIARAHLEFYAHVRG